MAIWGITAIVAMTNGMIGGVILVLPLLSLHSGTGFTAIVLTISAIFSFYSCYLCVIHLGKEKDLDYAIVSHFYETKIGRLIIKIFYDFVVFINLLFLLILYF